MLKKLISSFTFLILSGAASADLLSFVIEVGVMPASYQVSLDAPQFNDMGGTRILDSVTLTLEGEVSGIAGAESPLTIPQTFVLTLEAELTLSDALSSAFIEVTPTAARSFDASAFDGNIDFGGTSGVTYTDMFASELMSQTFTNAGTLAYFSGTDVASLILDAVASSSVTGAGGLSANLNTNAAARITIEYRYTDPLTVSAPSNLALLCLGLLGFVVYRKYK